MKIVNIRIDAPTVGDKQGAMSEVEARRNDGGGFATPKKSVRAFNEVISNSSFLSYRFGFTINKFDS